MSTNVSILNLDNVAFLPVDEYKLLDFRDVIAASNSE